MNKLQSTCSYPFFPSRKHKKNLQFSGNTLPMKYEKETAELNKKLQNYSKGRAKNVKAGSVIFGNIPCSQCIVDLQ